MASNEDLNLLTDIITFLKNYSWLHNFPAIRIFSINVLDSLPEDWQLWFQSKNYDISQFFPSESMTVECESLKSFITNCHKFAMTSLLQASCKYLKESEEYIVDLSSLNFQRINNYANKNEELIHKTDKNFVQNGFESASSTRFPAVSIPNRSNESKLNDFDSESFPSKVDERSQSISNEIWKKIKQANPKKRHEVEQLSKFVSWIKGYTKSDKVLDIGSGLGYLDLYLHLMYGYKIIGGEGLLDYVRLSLKLRDKCLESSCPNVKFIHWKVEDDITTLEKSLEVTTIDLSEPCSCVSSVSRLRQTCTMIESVCKEQEYEDFCKNATLEPEGSKFRYRNDSSIDLVSLHSCGDLSPIMLKIFVNNKSISSVVSLSCCYHKMLPVQEEVFSDDSNLPLRGSSDFKNFPLSQTLSQVMRKEHAKISTFGLRLASEEGISHWKTRARDRVDEDVMNIAYRSILQDVCEKNILKMKKLKRRCGKKSSYKSFKEYIQVILKEYQFFTISGEEYSDSNYLASRLEIRYLEVKNRIPYVGLVRVLQLNLQPVIENLVLLDRVLYLRESGFSHVGVIKLFDELISPRNKGIFAVRDAYWNT